jgi:predicted small lipoprotein YifL
MRLIPSLFVALVALPAVTACGTKTPLTLPPQPAAATKAVTPTPNAKPASTAADGTVLAPTTAIDITNKVPAEQRQ